MQAAVSSIAQTLPQMSAAKSNSTPLGGNVSGDLSAGESSIKDSIPIPVDTVSISYQSRQTMTDEKKRGANNEEVDNAVKSSGKLDKAITRVQFVYNLKGSLSIRYMDNANRLIYQVPSELMMRLSEAISKSNSSVDMKA